MDKYALTPLLISENKEGDGREGKGRGGGGGGGVRLDGGSTQHLE